MHVRRTTRRSPGGYVTYPDGTRGGDARVQQSVAIGNPNGTRLHLLRNGNLRTRTWTAYTAILTLGRVHFEIGHRS